MALWRFFSIHQTLVLELITKYWIMRGWTVISLELLLIKIIMIVSKCTKIETDDESVKHEGLQIV